MKNNREVKLCQYCQIEIPKKIKVCPNCKKKQKNSIIQLFWIITGSIFVLLYLLSSPVEEDNSTTDTTNEDVINVETTTIKTELTEEEYKSFCEEIIYNDIDEGLIGKLVYKDLIWHTKGESEIYNSCAAIEDFNETFNFYQHSYRVYEIKDCRLDNTFPIESNDIVRVYGVVDEVQMNFSNGLYYPKISAYYIDYIRKYGKEAEGKTMSEIENERYEKYAREEAERNYKNSLNTDYSGETKNIDGMDELPLEEFMSHCDKLNYNNLYNGEDYTGRYVCIHAELFSHKRFKNETTKKEKFGNWENILDRGMGNIII